MEANFGAFFSAPESQFVGYNNPPNLNNQRFATPAIQYEDAQKTANGLMALASYMMANVNTQETRGIQSQNDNEIVSEINRLKSHPKLITLEGLKESAKYAITINNSGRLMVDGNLYNGVIRTRLEDEIRHVEYRLGNPVTILSEYKKDENGYYQEKTPIRLTKYEYCKQTPYITKTEKTLIYEGSWDNPENEAYLTVPLSIQKQAGITKNDNIVKR